MDQLIEFGHRIVLRAEQCLRYDTTADAAARLIDEQLLALTSCRDLLQAARRCVRGAVAAM